VAWASRWADDGHPATAPAGSYPTRASPYGALDRAGNAWEWMRDWYNEAYYTRSPRGRLAGPVGGKWRVPHGASCATSLDIHLASRSSCAPRSGTFDLGFDAPRFRDPGPGPICGRLPSSLLLQQGLGPVSTSACFSATSSRMKGGDKLPTT
jgi:hypothetical protein